MRTILHPIYITHSILRDKSAAYDDTIPTDLRDLSKSRYETIPNALAQRTGDSSSSSNSTSGKKNKAKKPSLEKSELVTLVDWKLKHGTYRPNLAKLIASNTPSDVQEVTSSAFTSYEEKNNLTPGAGRSYRTAMRELVKLKGVGPATASLVLSCWDPEHVVFMGDEVFRWLLFDELDDDGGGGSKKRKLKGKEGGTAWERKIGYTVKEYQLLFERCEELRARLAKDKEIQEKGDKDFEKVTAAEVERAAYVIHREDTARSVSGQKRGRSDYDGGGGKASKDGKEEQEGEEDDNDDESKSKKRTRTTEKAGTKPSREESEDPTSAVFRKGPNGSPTYDRLGYELDRDYVLKYCGGGRPRPLSKRAQKHIEEQGKEEQRKMEIIGLPESCNRFHACDDRVARDLGIAYHEVGVEEYERWAAKGFNAKKEDFENPSEEEKDRLFTLMQGCALRKGSKHR